MDLHNVDLNLLKAFDALMAERSVTRAALRLRLSQPATSAALARLRELFGDPLLIRTANGMRPTAKAVRLMAPVRDALTSIQGIVGRVESFDPTTSGRRFRIAMPDHLIDLLLPELTRLVGREAPAIDLLITHYRYDRIAAQLKAGEIDAAVGSLFPPPKHVRCQKLFPETVVSLVAADNHAVGRKLTLNTFLALPHLLVSYDGDPWGYIDDILAERGLKRRVAMTVPVFTVVPHILPGTPLICTIASSVARNLGDDAPVRQFPPPLPIDSWDTEFMWDISRNREPDIAWLRGRVVTAARAVRPRTDSAS